MFDVNWLMDHQGWLFALAAVSVLMFIGSLIALPFLLARIPEDYFIDPHRHAGRWRHLHPMAYLLFKMTKNLFGWTLILAGILMLVLPGQGILTILMGLVLSDFPGKYRLERRLASNPRILSAINWVRKRSGHAPLLSP